MVPLTYLWLTDRDTKLGVWFYAKIDQLYTWAANRYGLKLITDEEKRMAKFPQLRDRLDKLEKDIEEIKIGSIR